MLWRTRFKELEATDPRQKAIGQMRHKGQRLGTVSVTKHLLRLETGPSLHKPDPRCPEYSQVEAALTPFSSPGWPEGTVLTGSPPVYLQAAFTSCLGGHSDDSRTSLDGQGQMRTAMSRQLSRAGGRVWQQRYEKELLVYLYHNSNRNGQGQH